MDVACGREFQAGIKNITQMSKQVLWRPRVSWDAADRCVCIWIWLGLSKDIKDIKGGSGEAKYKEAKG